MNDITFLTATEQAEAIQSGKFSSRDLVEAYLARLDRWNRQLRALVTIDASRARSRADQADQARQRGEGWGPLHGVPVTFKDAFETAGLRTTCSFEELADYIPVRDATVVSRLREAGAIVLGKSNLPRLLGDVQTASPMHGVACNPWHLGRTPGGTSGGEGVALAAGLSSLGVGSDFAGSVRLPAHFCGVFALKPTEHLVSNAGHIPPLPGIPPSARIMSGPGPIARSVADLRLALRVLAGPDDRDTEVVPFNLVAPPPKPVAQVRLAWTDAFGGLRVSEEIKAAIAGAAERLKAAGFQVDRADPPEVDFLEACDLYADLYGAIVLTPLPGVYRTLGRLVAAVSPDRYLRRAGRHGSSSTKDYFASLSRRDTLSIQLDTFLRRYDAWLCPVASVVAFPHRKPDRPDRPVVVDGNRVSVVEALTGHTVPFNLGGQPAVAIPLCRNEEGLPIGLQLVAPKWSDLALLNIAEQVAQTLGGYARPPEPDNAPGR